MKQIFAFLFILTILPSSAIVNAQKASFPSLQQLQSPQSPRLGFIIHGGAGVITKGSLTPEKEKEFRRLLNEYISKTNFGVTAPVKFAQCSPVTYKS